MDISFPLTALNAKCEDNLCEDSIFTYSQKQLSFKVDSYNKESLVSAPDLSLRDKARLSSVSLPKAGCFLNAIPSKALGLHLSNREFQCCVRYRLGVPVFSSSGPCPACSSPSNCYGDHAIICGYNGERIGRHNMLRDALYRACCQAGLCPVRESQALLPDSDSRPADVLLPSFDQGRDCALDVTVVSPLQQSLLVKAGEEPGAALTYAYERKMRQSSEACQQAGLHFFPLPFETFGGLHPKSISIVTTISRALSAHSGNPSSEVTSHLFQRLGVLLAKGNSALILSRAPKLPSADLDGDQDSQ